MDNILVIPWRIFGVTSKEYANAYYALKIYIFTRFSTVARTPKYLIFCLLGVWARHYRGFFTFACLVYGLNVFVFYSTKSRVEKNFLYFKIIILDFDYKL